MDKSQIGVICKSPRATRERQLTALREAGAQWFAELGRYPKTWRDVVNVVREGDTVFIYALSLVPTKRGEDELPPSAQVSEFLMEVHERGGVVVEVYSGRKSSDRKARRAMVADAHKALKRGSRALPPTGRGRGRPALTFTLEQIAEAKRVWTSPDYATNVIAKKYLPKGFTLRRCWDLWGASGRPFKPRRKGK